MSDSKALLEAIDSYLQRMQYIERAQALLDAPERYVALEQVSLSKETIACMDNWCQEAATLLKTPSSVVSIVGESLEIVAGYGMDKEKAIPRDRSLCIFVATSGQQFDVNDLTDNERTSCFAYTELEVRAYLGAPVKVHGQTVGSFCVVDYRPREWSSSDRYLIDSYAQKISRTLEQEKT